LIFNGKTKLKKLTIKRRSYKKQLSKIKIKLRMINSKVISANYN